MKNRRHWFSVPGGKLPDLDEIFREAFNEVFPDHWTKVRGAVSASIPTETVAERLLPTVNELADLFGETLDNWDDSDSE